MPHTFGYVLNIAFVTEAPKGDSQSLFLRNVGRAMVLRMKEVKAYWVNFQVGEFVSVSTIFAVQVSLWKPLPNWPNSQWKVRAIVPFKLEVSDAKLAT